MKSNPHWDITEAMEVEFFFNLGFSPKLGLFTEVWFDELKLLMRIDLLYMLEVRDDLENFNIYLICYLLKISLNRIFYLREI